MEEGRREFILMVTMIIMMIKKEESQQEIMMMAMGEDGTGNDVTITLIKKTERVQKRLR